MQEREIRETLPRGELIFAGKTSLERLNAAATFLEHPDDDIFKAIDAPCLIFTRKTGSLQEYLTVIDRPFLGNTFFNLLTATAPLPGQDIGAVIQDWYKKPAYGYTDTLKRAHEDAYKGRVTPVGTAMRAFEPHRERFIHLLKEAQEYENLTSFLETKESYLDKIFRDIQRYWGMFPHVPSFQNSIPGFHDALAILVPFLQDEVYPNTQPGEVVDRYIEDYWGMQGNRRETQQKRAKLHRRLLETFPAEKIDALFKKHNILGEAVIITDSIEVGFTLNSYGKWYTHLGDGAFEIIRQGEFDRMVAKPVINTEGKLAYEIVENERDPLTTKVLPVSRWTIDRKASQVQRRMLTDQLNPSDISVISPHLTNGQAHAYGLPDPLVGMLLETYYTPSLQNRWQIEEGLPGLKGVKQLMQQAQIPAYILFPDHMKTIANNPFHTTVEQSVTTP